MLLQQSYCESEGKKHYTILSFLFRGDIRIFWVITYESALIYMNYHSLSVFFTTFLRNLQFLFDNITRHVLSDNLF